jgi:hypothetical protein
VNHHLTLIASARGGAAIQLFWIASLLVALATTMWLAFL